MLYEVITVLTHDVERQGGVNKCLQLMEIEKKHGFRSSFNFVPHDYVVVITSYSIHYTKLYELAGVKRAA